MRQAAQRCRASLRRWRLPRCRRRRRLPVVVLLALGVLLLRLSRTMRPVLTSRFVALRTSRPQRHPSGYIALTGCCARAGLGHTLTAFNRVVHLALLDGYTLAYDPAPLRGLGHGIGDRAEAVLNLGRGEIPIDQIPKPHQRVNVNAAIGSDVSDTTLRAHLRQYLRRHTASPAAASPVLLELHRWFNPGGALAPDWSRTLDWWRAKYAPRPASCRHHSAPHRRYCIAIHVRRGDQAPGWRRRGQPRYLESGLRRNLPDAWYAAAAEAAWRAHCRRQRSACRSRPWEVHLHTESPLVDMDGAPSRLRLWLAQRFPQASIHLHLDGDALGTLESLTGADVLVGSRSAFSYLAARFTAPTSTVLLPPLLPSSFANSAAPALPCGWTRGSWRPYRAYGPLQLVPADEPNGMLFWPHREEPKANTSQQRPAWRRSRKAVPARFAYQFGPLADERRWIRMVHYLLESPRSPLSPTLHDSLHVRDACST
ncbi:hypothetical protein CDCA_CDCA07G2243 [Cyanidium caldarium]|uniref:Uncharacterized protein n=1 Tax=Cyanidium caldarium TaxID=2771 RepID=A0AAV9IVA2_CYACA|nr:hypothetical protein CDCA_CDCA07G2243 [Cyanidium caldarium]